MKRPGRYKDRCWNEYDATMKIRGANRIKNTNLQPHIEKVKKNVKDRQTDERMNERGQVKKKSELNTLAMRRVQTKKTNAILGRFRLTYNRTRS